MATQVAVLRTMLEADSVQKQFYNALKENKDAPKETKKEKDSKE